jgi:hypothetical protein
MSLMIPGWMLEPPLSVESCDRNHVIGLGCARAVLPPSSCQRVALVIHGVATTWKFMERLGSFLGRLESTDESGGPRYDWVGYVAFDWRLPIEENGRDLRHLLEAIAPGRDVIDLFAYSQGGLLCRGALDLDGDSGMPVHHLVTFNTPHTGSPLSRIIRWMRPATRWKEGLGAWTCPGLHDVAPGSDFLRQLEERPGAAGIRRLYVAGDAGRWLVLGFTQLFFLGRRNDGIVAVDSQLDQARSGDIHRLATAWNHFTVARGLVEARGSLQSGTERRPVTTMASALSSFLTQA